MAEHRFHKGDRVRFHFGIYPVQGIIKEDIGPIGVKGRRLYRVSFQFGLPDEPPSEIELPAIKMQLIQDTVPTE